MDKPQSWIYFVQLGDSGPVKIGTARNVRTRLAGLQCGTIETLRLIAVIPGARDMEKKLHSQFDEYRLRGEWFEFGPALAAIIDAADPEDVQGLRSKRGLGRAPDEIARGPWFDKSLTVAEALDRMPGWTFPTAYYHFGRRDVPFPKISEHAVKMARKRWDADGHRGVVDKWHSAAMRKELARWQQHWRDPIYSSADAAFEAFPDEIKDEFGSMTTARRVFGRRRPHDPTAGGRPPKKPKR